MRFILALIIGLLASPAFAQQWASTCIDTVVNPVTEVGGSSVACFNFDTELVTTNSDAIHVRTDSAIICLNPSDDMDGADVAQVHIRKCLGGVNVTAVDENCPRILDNPLTGLPGIAGTQNACIRVSRGVYYVEITTASAGDNPSVTIEGEGN